MIDLVLRSVLTPGVLAARWAGLAQLPASIADVPATRWSVGLATKMIMDEVFFLTEALSIQLVSVRDRRRIDEEMAAALQAKDIVVERLVLPGLDHFTASYHCGETKGGWLDRATAFITRHKRSSSTGRIQ